MSWFILGALLFSGDGGGVAPVGGAGFVKVYSDRGCESSVILNTGYITTIKGETYWDKPITRINTQDSFYFICEPFKTFLNKFNTSGANKKELDK